MSEGDRPLWVHVGAGQIGLGVVLPLVADYSPSRIRLLTISRLGTRSPKQNPPLREPEQGRRTVWLGARAISCRVDIHEEGRERSSLRLNFSLNKARPLTTSGEREFAFVNDLAEARTVLGEASFISTALGEEGLAELHRVLHEEAGPRSRRIFLFENRYGQFADGAGVKKGECSCCEVVPVIVDRLSIQRHDTFHVIGDCAELATVTVEQQCQLLSNSMPEFVSQESSWQQIAPPHTFAVKYKQKRYLVNALHTAIALMGHARLRELGFDGALSQHQAFPVVVDAILRDRDNFRMLDVFGRAQALRLLLESDPSSVAKDGAGGALLFDEYVECARRAIARFGRFPDELSRVVADSDSKRRARFVELVAPVEDFVRGLDLPASGFPAATRCEDSAAAAAKRWHELRNVRGRVPIPEVCAVIEKLRGLL